MSGYVAATQHFRLKGKSDESGSSSAETERFPEPFTGPIPEAWSNCGGAEQGAKGGSGESKTSEVEQMDVKANCRSEERVAENESVEGFVD